METKNAENVVWIVKYTFGREWYEHSTHEDLFYAKQAERSMKKHIGTCGKVKIIKEVRRA